MALPRGLLVHPDELGDLWISRLRGSDIKIVGLHPVGGKKAHEYVEDLRRDIVDGKFDTKFAALREMGIDIEFEMHAMSWLLPRSEYEAHPDWFRMNREGERIADFNLCPSSKEALSFVAARAAELAKVFRPTTHRYYFWIDDVRDGACHCEHCKGLSVSDQALLIYNAMLEGIRTVDPLATHCYLAYQNTREVPVKVVPSAGIFLEYAPFDRDFHKPLSDASCEKNASEIAPLSGLLSYFGKANSKVLEYWLDNSLFSKWKKPPQPFVNDVPVMREDLRFYEALGFEDATVFACYLGEDYEALHGAPSLDEYLKYE